MDGRDAQQPAVVGVLGIAIKVIDFIETRTAGVSMTVSNKNRAIAAELMAKASRDRAFRQQFLANPRAQLIAAGAEIAADVEICAVENTETLRYTQLMPVFRRSH